MQKQNKAGRIALMLATILLCATLITTSALSTTLAKYTTSDGVGSVSARVAKWGLTLEPGTNTKGTWIVGETPNSITAASASTSEKIVAPGTSGYLAYFRLTGNPEVAQNIDFNFDVTVQSGYEKLIAQNTYFPILITVGRTSFAANHSVIGRNEKYFYATDSTTMSTLAFTIKTASENGELDEVIAPNGWTDDGYADYYVRWDWFYDGTDIPSHIPSAVKTALTAYQTEKNDTALADAMVQRLDVSAINNSKYDALNSQITSATTAYSNGNGSEANCKTAITNLEAALAAYLGRPVRTFSYTKSEAMTINWKALHEGGLMRSTGRNFKTNTNLYNCSDNYDITSSAGTNSYIKLQAKNTTAMGQEVEMFYLMNHTYPLTEDTYYVYDFHARNIRAKGYGGVVFAHNGTNTYTLYGGFTNESDKGSCFHLKVMQGYCANGGTVKIGEKTGTVQYSLCGTSGTNAENYGIYRIIYNGLNVTVQYKSSATAYSDLGTFALPAGSFITLGSMARYGYGSGSYRSLVIRTCKLTKTSKLSPQTVLRDLINEATAVKNMYAAASNGFTLSANASITITQIKPSDD